MADYGWFGAFWSLTLVVGFGLFLPLDIELTRLVHRRGPGAGLPPGTLRAVSGLTGLGLAAVAASWPLLRPALGGRAELLVALLAVVLVSAGQFLLRGLLMGRGRLRAYGIVLVADNVLRLALAALVAVAVPGAAAEDFAWTVVAGSALAHLPLLAWALRSSRGTSRTVEGTTTVRPEALGHLMLGSLCGQALLNAAPVLVTSVAEPGEHALAAAFVAGFTLVRLPLFVAVPLQGALLRPLTRAGAAGRAHQRRMLVRLGSSLAVAALLAGAAGALVGPQLIGLLFGERYTLPAADVAVLAVGSVLHLGLLVTSQSLVAVERHGDSGRAWLAGLVAAVAVFAVVPGLVERAALAFAVGSGVALAWSGAVLVRRLPSSPPPPRTGAELA